MKVFYLDFLGFEVDFEFWFEFEMLFYMGLKLGDCELYLFEYFGDVLFGLFVCIEIDDVDVYCKVFNVKKYKYVWLGY